MDYAHTAYRTKPHYISYLHSSYSKTILINRPNKQIFQKKNIVKYLQIRK